MSVPEKINPSEVICSMSYAVSRIGTKAYLALDLVRMTDKVDENYPIPYEASSLVPELQAFYQNTRQVMFTAMHEVLKCTQELRSHIEELSACAACTDCTRRCPNENHLSAPKGGV